MGIIENVKNSFHEETQPVIPFSSFGRHKGNWGTINELL